MALDGFPKNVTTKHGLSLVVRPVRRGDETALLAFYRALPAEDRLFLKDDVTTESWAERFLQRIERGEAISLIAEQGGRVVAEATLNRPRHGWSTHVGELRVAVDRASRRKGAATTLAGLLLKVATDLGVEKLIVEVLENQVAARRVFETLGFEKEAILRGHVKDISGIRRDLLILANDVSHVWEAMEALVADTPPEAE